MLAIEKDAALTTAQTQRNSIVPRWLKIPAAVTYSGICRSRIYDLLNAGKVKSHLIGTARLVDRESLDAFISSQPATAA